MTHRGRRRRVSDLCRGDRRDQPVPIVADGPAHFGLTPRKYQSGETDYTGRISKIGDASVRTALYEAAQSF